MTDQELRQALIAAVNAINLVCQALDEGKTDPQTGKISNRWIPVSERLPESDDQLVVVRTLSGAQYFSRTINGKFRNNETEWFPLPEN